jgi:hypothetical protein
MRSHRHTSPLLAALALACAGLACTGSVDAPDPDEHQGDELVLLEPPVIGLGDQDQWAEALDSRDYDYGQALRSAALRLTGDLPTLAEIKFVTQAADQKLAYEAVIDAYLDDPRFSRMVRNFWRDTFKMGGGGLDGAPVFAAQLVVEDRSFMELFTATSGTCPSVDTQTGTFTAADCDSGAPTKAGILTNPDVQGHFFSNMAFRRVRWIQETFVCTKYPAEVIAPVDLGGASAYTSPWPFESVAGVETGGKVDFRDMSAVTCANCHSTMNRQAPLFAHFDEDGMWMMDMVVPTPVEGAPLATITDYLPPGDTQLAWRHGIPVADLASFGGAMAADPDVAECAVARVWNFAMGKGDIVAALALVPSSVIAQQTSSFQQNGYRLKETFRQVFTSDDFVRF